MSEEAILAALQVHNKERCNTPLNAEEVQRIASSVARYGQGAPVASKGINHRTDLGNAKRLVARHGRDIRYCFSWGKWLVWDGRRWTEDDTGEVLRRAKQTVASIYGEAGQETDTDARKAKAKHAMASEAEAKIRAMVKMAQSEPEIPLRLADLDADPWLLNVLNGTLDLRNGARNPHRQEDLIMKLAPVEHDPATTCPKWLAFLHLILDGNQDLIHFLQKCVGYALTGDVREQCLFLLYGTGANGKTTFLEVIRALLGNYAKQADFSTFLARPQDRIPNDLARLQGARFVSAVEAESGRRLSEVMVKRATGSDTLTARFLHHEFFEFQAMFKLFLAGNHKPIISGTDHATWRRIRLIPFTVTIPDEKQDKELLAKLKAELPGILAWALQGCRDWQREGLEIPATVAEATKEYQVEMDWLAGFIFDRCVKDPAARTTAEDLFKAYEQYCKDEEEVARSQKIFGTGLKERGFINKKGGGGRWVWHGIRLVTDVTDGDPSSDLSREDSGQDERSREEGHKGHLWTPAEPQSPNDTGPPEILCVQKDPVRTRTDPTEDFFLE
jgi:putative DNA primase/helicase